MAMSSNSSVYGYAKAENLYISSRSIQNIVVNGNE